VVCSQAPTNTGFTIQGVVVLRGQDLIDVYFAWFKGLGRDSLEVIFPDSAAETACETTMIPHRQRVALGQDWSPKVWCPETNGFQKSFGPTRDNVFGCPKPSYVPSLGRDIDGFLNEAIIYMGFGPRGRYGKNQHMHHASSYTLG
jgi:hypothetical protein